MMSSKNVIASGADYEFASSDAPHTAGYLYQPILNLCKQLNAQKILDLGCGNGALCRILHKNGFRTVGCDPSLSGIEHAKQILPEENFKVLGVYDNPEDLQESDFDVVISTEVIEHLFYPRSLPQFAHHVLKPGGCLIISTPYHGYVKNLLLSLTNKWDFHHTPLWDGGHVKFWSRQTLTTLLNVENFKVVQFIGTGRLPYLWKSMIIVAQKN